MLPETPCQAVIDLQAVSRQIGQPRKRRMSRSEIIQNQSRPDRLQGKRVGVIICGANIDFATFEAQAIF